VPGRPIQYKTTANFLRTFGLESLEDLPAIEKVSLGEPEVTEEPVDPNQMTMEEV
jgi:segregation and condensation protein B